MIRLQDPCHWFRSDEKETEKYLMFEKVLKTMDWPTDISCVFLQSVLTGKGMDVYYVLPSNFETFHVNPHALKGLYNLTIPICE